MKGRTHDNVAVAAGASNNQDLLVTELDRITFFPVLFATVVGADLTFGVRAYDDKDVLFDLPLGAEDSVAIASDGANVRGAFRHELAGVDRVQVRVTNNNVASKNATVSYFGDR